MPEAADRAARPGGVARRLRVLHLSDRLSERGGAHLWLLAVVRELVRDGHETILAVGEQDAALPAPCPLARVPGLAARGEAPVAAALDRLAEQLRPDAIHVHTVVNPLALEWAAGRGAAITVQDHRCFCPTRGKWRRDGAVCREAMARETCAGCFEEAGYFEEMLALTERRLAAVRRMRAVTVLSGYMRDELAALGVDRGRIHVVPPWVDDLDADGVADGPPCVLFVGRLAEAKGVRDAVAAWRLSGLSLPLVLAGTGPLRAELEREPGLEVLGWVPRARLAAVYRRARALLMPSRWQEPYGIAGLEARALGVPVVAWDSGGVREWHAGDETLVPWGDVPRLAAALRTAAGRGAGGFAGALPARGGLVEPPDGAVAVQNLLNLYISLGSPATGPREGP